MLPITSVWIAILITVQSVFAVAIRNRDLEPIARSVTHPSTKLSRDENYFRSPSDTDSASASDSVPVYDVGDVLEISWTTTLDVFNVTLWQRDLSRGNNGTAGVRSGGNIFSKTSSSSTLSNISWIVQPYALDLEKSSTFFLSIDAYTNAIAHSNSDLNSKLDYEDWPSTGFVSGEFNISSSSSSTTSTQSNTDTSKETTIGQRSETTNTPESSLTSTGKIALGLGAGIGAPLISLLAILAYFQVRNARRKYASTQHAQHQHQHHPSIPPPPEMSLSMPGIAQHPHHQGLGLGVYPPPFSVSPNSNPGMNMGDHVPYRNPVPSELSQKVAKPVVLPPWEADAAPDPSSPTSAPGPNSRTGNTNGVTRANTTITVIPRPNARPHPRPAAARGLGIERERGRRGPGLGEGTGPGKRSMWSTRRVGQPDTGDTGGNTGGRQSTITIGIPELPGENYI
ncbi:hypothetical protein BJX62DRAFT_30064 [Aspergillus germanicus]